MWVSRHQKGKPFWILLKQEMMGWQWRQLDHMQIICITLQTDNHASTYHSIFYGLDALPDAQPRPHQGGGFGSGTIQCGAGNRKCPHNVYHNSHFNNGDVHSTGDFALRHVCNGAGAALCGSDLGSIRTYACGVASSRSVGIFP